MSALLYTISLLATLVVTAYLYVKHLFSYWKRRGVPYKEPSFPFGNFLEAFTNKKSVGEVLKDLYNSTTEPFIGIYSTYQPTLLVRDPKIIRDIFIKDFQSFDHRGWNSNVNVDPMSDNILHQHGEKWKMARSQLSPAFSPVKLKSIFDVVNKSRQSVDDYVSTFADADKTIEIRDVFARYATNVIVSVAFGLEIDCIKNRDEAFRTLGPRFFEATFTNMFRNTLSIMTPRLSQLLGLRFVDKDVGEFMIDVVKQHVEYRESNNVSRKDLFQLLIQMRNNGKIADNDDWSTKASSEKKAFTIEEMAAQAHLFFVGGFESSSSTMSFLMYELAKNPDIQQKAYEEIVEVLAKHDGKLTYDSISDMKYVSQCLDETLRMHPPFPMVVRRCTKDYPIADTNVVIEKGTLLMFVSTGLQYDSKYYEEPHKFKPDRYSAAQKAGKTFLEMPNLTFGEGPRKCLGGNLGKLQSKTATVSLLRQFRFELGDEHKSGELKLNPLCRAATPINGINLKVFKR